MYTQTGQSFLGVQMCSLLSPIVLVTVFGTKCLDEDEFTLTSIHFLCGTDDTVKWNLVVNLTI